MEKYYVRIAVPLLIMTWAEAFIKMRVIMRAQRCIRWTGTLPLLVLLSCCAFCQETHYSRFRDAEWYARQIQTLQDEIAKIDIHMRLLVQARKSGQGVTATV